MYSSQELNCYDETTDNVAHNNLIITKAFNIEITRSDINNIITGHKLNDSILNFYLKLICNSCFSKKVACIDSLITFKILNSNLRGLHKSLERLNAQNFSSIFCPLFLTCNHWALIYIDVINKNIKYYDSIFTTDTNVIYQLCSVLGKYVKVLGGSEHWNISFDHNYPKQQGNDTDCGVFVCTYAKYLAFNRTFDFGQDQIDEIRKSMASEIINFEIDQKFIQND